MNIMTLRTCLFPDLKSPSLKQLREHECRLSAGGGVRHHLLANARAKACGGEGAADAIFCLQTLRKENLADLPFCQNNEEIYIQ